MKNNNAYFTASQFAKLHHLNTRTLHYYDDIGLFSPQHKGENGYRYYTYAQSMVLENILALRELNMSIDEIKAYTSNPNPDDFLALANSKIKEIDETITHLKKLKKSFCKKKELLNLCTTVYNHKIELVELDAEYLLLTPLSLNFEIENTLITYTPLIMEHLQSAWELSPFKQSCGSFISIEKVKNEQFDTYDGIFTAFDQKKKNLYVKPKGLYIRGFCLGSWNKLPNLYKKIFQFAEDHKLTLTGYAFERGINEFVSSCMSDLSQPDRPDYVTQIEIHCIKQT